MPDLAHLAPLVALERLQDRQYLRFELLHAIAIMVLALFVMRWVFVSARSDWWGGWGIGPRYLLPMVPFLLLPLAELLEDLRHASRGRRLAVALALVTCVAVELHLSLHSIFEWMLSLTTTIETGSTKLAA